MTDRAILAAEAPVQQPGPLALPTTKPRVLPAVPDLRRLRAAEDSATPERPTLAVIIDRYLTWKAAKAAKLTVKTYTDGLRLFSQWLAMAGINAFEETADALPARIMEEYVVWVRGRPSKRTGRPLAPTSVALYHAAVTDLFKYAARREWLPDRFKWAEMKADAAETLGKGADAFRPPR